MSKSAFFSRVLVILAAVALLALPLSASAQELNMAGVQVWNVDYWQTISIGDLYGPNYKILKLDPIRLTGTRNGTFSAYVVLTNSNGTIRELSATITDLVGDENAKIPASNIQIRYPEPAMDAKGWAPDQRFEALLPTVPDEIPVRDPRKISRYKPINAAPVAMQPVWITVTVPKDAVGGDYEGTLEIKAEDLGVTPMKLKVQMTVAEYTLPDPKDYTIRNMAVYSPDRVAAYYEVPMWSDKHFEYMGKSLELMLRAGSREAVVPLICNYPSTDNPESMVRWIKQEDGSYKHDFTIFEKYCDTVAKSIGKPFPLRLLFLFSQREHIPGPKVNVVDPKTGQVGTMETPTQGSAEALTFWKPVLDGIRERVEKRGWYDVTTVNWINYCGGPGPEIVDMIYKIWPDGRWSSMDHGRRTSFEGTIENSRMLVQVSTTVWNEGGVEEYAQWDKKTSPGPRNFKGRFRDNIAVNGHARGRHREWSPLWVPRTMTEELLMRGCNGIDPLGADLWPLKVRGGRYVSGIWAQYALGAGNAVRAYLAPGPDGPVGTERYEAFCEGVQICNTMLYLQSALDGGNLSEKLTARVNKVLDDRARHYIEAYKPTDDKGHRGLDVVDVAKGNFERETDLWATADAVARALAKAGK